MLDSKAKQIVREIWNEVIDEVQKILEMLHQVEIEAEDLSKSEVAKHFKVDSQVTSFKEAVKQYSSNIKGQIAQLVPEVKKFNSEEDELAQVLEKHQGSPFASKNLKLWLDNKPTEIKILRIHTETLSELPNIDTSFSRGSFDTSWEKYKLCFAFHCVQDPFLEVLSSYQQNLCLATISSTPAVQTWSDSTRMDLQNKVRAFKEFAQTNTQTGCAYIITVNSDNGSTSSSKSTSVQGPVTILLFSETEPNIRPFTPPSKPEKPSAVQSVLLTWIVHDKNESVNSYTVEVLNENKEQFTH